MKKLILFIILLLIPTLSHAWSVVDAVYGHWELNDNAANSTVTDSFDSLTGTLFKPGSAQNTSLVHVTGKVGTGAFLFDGSVTGYAVDLTATPFSFTRTTPFSVEAWFKTSDSTDEMDIASKMDNNSGTGWAVEMASGSIQVLLISAAPTSWIDQHSTSTYSDGNWHHLIVTYSGASVAAGITIYIDGSPVAKDSPIADNLTTTINYNAAVACLGSRNNGVTGTGQPFNGTLDEMLVYNRVITQDEVTGRYNSGNGTEALSGGTTTGIGFFF